MASLSRNKKDGGTDPRAAKAGSRPAGQRLNLLDTK
jgi:hypothetical protein